MWRITLRICGVTHDFFGDGPFLIGRRKCISRTAMYHADVSDKRGCGWLLDDDVRVWRLGSYDTGRATATPCRIAFTCMWGCYHCAWCLQFYPVTDRGVERFFSRGCFYVIKREPGGYFSLIMHSETGKQPTHPSEFIPGTSPCTTVQYVFLCVPA